MEYAGVVAMKAAFVAALSMTMNESICSEASALSARREWHGMQYLYGRRDSERA